MKVGFTNLRAEFGPFDGELMFMGRRGRGVAGLSLAASAGLLGAYIGYPGLRKAHAAMPCTVQNSNDSGPGSLRTCLDGFTGGTIDFAASANGTITLLSDLPQVTLTSSLTITGNGADSTIINGNSLGGLYFTGSFPVAVSSLSIQNTSAGTGGAVYAKGGDVTVTNSTFSGNTATYSGGAILAFGGDVTVTNSTFSGNTATTLDGGAVYAKGGDVTVTNSTFSGNTATNEGGAVSTDGGDVTVTNSTFSGNTGDLGGAIFAFGGDVILNFATIVGNTSSYTAVFSDGNVSVTNSIVYGNPGGFDVAGSSLSASHSLFTSTSSVSPTVSGATLIFGEDPLLGSLADNGGPTQTMMPGAGSPVLGAANPAGAPSTDQRGYTRTTNGRADMGAVERLGLPPDADPSQVPPSWQQAQGREQQRASCPPGMAPSWAQWPNEGTGGWTCEYTTWWDVNEGVGGGWVTTPGLRAGSMPGR